MQKNGQKGNNMSKPRPHDVVVNFLPMSNGTLPPEYFEHACIITNSSDYAIHHEHGVSYIPRVNVLSIHQKVRKDA